MNIASQVEYCLLGPATRLAEIEKHCQEAVALKVRAVCIPPGYVKTALSLLTGSNTRVSTVIGFPFGYSATESKLSEAVLAIVDGAHEIDIMTNMAAVKNADWPYLAKEASHLVPLIQQKGVTVKIILEAAVMTENELRTCCDIYGAAGVNIIKTGSGYSVPVVTSKVINILRQFLADAIVINAVCSDEKNNPVNDLIQAGAHYISLYSFTELERACGLASSGMIFDNNREN